MEKQLWRQPTKQQHLPPNTGCEVFQKHRNWAGGSRPGSHAAIRLLGAERCLLSAMAHGRRHPANDFILRWHHCSALLHLIQSPCSRTELCGPSLVVTAFYHPWPDLATMAQLFDCLEFGSVGTSKTKRAEEVVCAAKHAQNRKIKNKNSPKSCSGREWGLGANSCWGELVSGAVKAAAPRAAEAGRRGAELGWLQGSLVPGASHLPDDHGPTS